MTAEDHVLVVGRSPRVRDPRQPWTPRTGTTPGVVDDCVDGAMHRGDMFGDRLDISGAGDVSTKEADAARLGLRPELARRSLQNLEAPSKDQHVGPVTGDRPRRGTADPGPTTRHDDDCSHDFPSRTPATLAGEQPVPPSRPTGKSSRPGSDLHRRGPGRAGCCASGLTG